MSISRRSGLIDYMVMVPIFLASLKLSGVIGWSWWWVFLPMWAPIAAVFVLAYLMFVALILWAVWLGLTEV